MVIIGLLIGGILVAQSLIESSKINSFVRQIQQYDAATILFKDRYKKLPGDISSFPAGYGGDSGNGDGNVRGRYGNDEYLDGETSSFWNHLSLAGVVERQYEIPIDPNAGIIPDVHMPLAEIGTNASIVVGTKLHSPPWGGATSYWVYGAPTDSLNTASSTHTYALTIEESFAAGAKIDDGKPNSGNVLKAGVYRYDLVGVNRQCADWPGHDGSVNQYNIQKIGVNPSLPIGCNLVVKLFHSLGLEEG